MFKKYLERFKEWIYEYNIDSFFAGIAFAMALGFIFYEWNNDWVARIDVIISVTAGLLLGLSLSYMLSLSDTEEEDI